MWPHELKLVKQDHDGGNRRKERKKKEGKENKPWAVPTPRGLAACVKTLGTAISMGSFFFHMGSLLSLPPISVL